MSSAEDLLARARGFWARRAGIPPEEWQDGQIVLVGSENASVSVVSMGSGALVWCPPHLHSRVTGMAPGSAVDLATLVERFADVLDKPLGSAALPYLSEDAFRAPDTDLTVSVEHSPIAGYESFLAASTPAEVGESGMPTELERRCWVSRVHGEIAALVTYEVWDGEVAHLLALTAATHRGAGHGASVAAGACADLLRERELLPQWRVSKENPASAAVARKLGFVTLGHQSTILLKHPAAEASQRARREAATTSIGHVR